MKIVTMVKNSINNDIIIIWESASISIITKYSISNKFDIFLINLIFRKFNNKENFNIQYLELFSR